MKILFIKSLHAACALFLLFICAHGFALTEPSVSLIRFGEEADEPILVHNKIEPGVVQSASLTGGRVLRAAGEDSAVWAVSADSPFGSGRLAVELNRDLLHSDLALVMDAELGADSDVTFQLFDRMGRGLAMDLFGEVEANARTVGTDTFIVPLSRYPDATRLVIRRLSGSVTVRELALVPVLGAFENTDELEREMAALLSESLARNESLPDREGNVVLGRIHVIPALETINAIGASALAKAGYPVYEPLDLTVGTSLFVPCSGTVYDFAKRADRLLALNRGEKCQLFFTSSSGVHWFFPGKSGTNSKGMPNRAEIGLASVPLSADKKAEFETTHGYPAIEIPIARSAIEVLVHQENPLESLGDWQLSAAFSEVGKAVTWKELGVDAEGWSDRSIQAYGGHSSWGTSRVFRSLALNGNPWRHDLNSGHDVVFSWGVEKMVGQDMSGIGYAVQRSREHAVKAVKLAPQGGGVPVAATEATIYSGKYPLQRRLFAIVAAPSLDQASPAVREWVNLILSAEGQTLMVRSNFLPLAKEEVLAWRKFLQMN